VISDPIDALIAGLLIGGAVLLPIPFFDRLTRNRK